MQGRQEKRRQEVTMARKTRAEKIRDLYAEVQQTPPYAEVAFLLLILLVGVIGWWVGQ